MSSRRTETVGDIMIRRFDVLRPDASLRDVVHTVLRRDQPCAPVASEDGRLLGMFSEFDCIGVLGEAVFEGWPEGTIADHMTKNPDALAPKDDLLRAVVRFREGRHRSLPVVSEGRLVGIVTRKELLRALDRMLDHERKTTYQLIAEHRG